jgi:hypothetical protein
MINKVGDEVRELTDDDKDKLAQLIEIYARDFLDLISGDNEFRDYLLGVDLECFKDDYLAIIAGKAPTRIYDRFEFYEQQEQNEIPFDYVMNAYEKRFYQMGIRERKVEAYDYAHSRNPKTRAIMRRIKESIAESKAKAASDSSG